MKRNDDEHARYPCPADGSELFGWTAAHDPLDRGRRIVLDRCEECGLSVTRDGSPPDAGAELDALIETGADGSVVLTAPNRRSWSGGVGGAQWAGLEPELHRLHLTPESARLLLSLRGLAVDETQTPFSSEGRRLMIQTFLNAFTYRDNFLANARNGRLQPSTGREHWLHRLDWVVTALVFVPAAILAVPLEMVAASFGRGGVMILKADRAE